MICSQHGKVEFEVRFLTFANTGFCPMITRWYIESILSKVASEGALHSHLCVF